MSVLMDQATQYSGDATSQSVSAMGAERETWTGDLRSDFLYELTVQRIRSRYVVSHTQMCFFPDLDVLFALQSQVEADE